MVDFTTAYRVLKKRVLIKEGVFNQDGTYNLNPLKERRSLPVSEEEIRATAREISERTDLYAHLTRIGWGLNSPEDIQRTLKELNLD